MKFRIGDIFKSSNGDFDIKKEHISENGVFVITAGLTENGILGRTEFPAKVFDKKTLTVDMFGNSFFRNFKYKMVTHARVFSLKPKMEVSKESGLFLSGAIHYLPKLFGYENMCSWAKINDREIQLPSKNSQPDFEFMETFIRAIEKLVITDVVKWLDAQIETTKQVVSRG